MLFTKTDDRYRCSGKCKQIVTGELMEAASGSAICQPEGEENLFLFGCDASRNSITNTWHETLEGATKTWQTL